MLTDSGFKLVVTCVDCIHVHGQVRQESSEDAAEMLAADSQLAKQIRSLEDSVLQEAALQVLMQ